MRLFAGLLCATLLFLNPAFGAPAFGTPEILAQKEMGPNACGPCAFLNSLVQSHDTAALDSLHGANSLAKARDFASRYGSGPSLDYGKLRSAYSNENGATDHDLLDMINHMRRDLHQEPLVGEYLQRKDGEGQGEFLQRVRRTIQDSLDGGFPPLLSVRSVVAQRTDKGDFVWNGISGHWVALLGIDEMAEGDPVNVLRIADSLAGRVISGLLAFEPRAAKVPITFKVDETGKEIWTWERSENCLFLNAPSLPIGTERQGWQERTYVAARYLIYRPRDARSAALVPTAPARKGAPHEGTTNDAPPR